MSQKAYRVLYRHSPDEESELAVAKGDIVVSSESPVDDWLEVQLYGQPQSRGFVPYNFLQQLSSSEALAYIGSAQKKTGGARKESPRGDRGGRGGTGTPRSLFEGSRFSSGGGKLSMEDLGASGAAGAQQQSSKPKIGSSQTGLSSGAFSTSSALGNRGGVDRFSASGKSLLSSSNAHTFSEAFARHEQYFKEVMGQREETYKRLEKSIGNTASEISACQDKNESLASKISELERLIDEERRRWRDRLEAEKTALQMKVFGGGGYGGGGDRSTPSSMRSTGSGSGGRFSQSAF